MSLPFEWRGTQLPFLSICSPSASPHVTTTIRNMHNRTTICKPPMSTMLTLPRKALRTCLPEPTQTEKIRYVPTNPFQQYLVYRQMVSSRLIFTCVMVLEQSLLITFRSQDASRRLSHRSVTTCSSCAPARLQPQQNHTLLCRQIFHRPKNTRSHKSMWGFLTRLHSFILLTLQLYGQKLVG